LETPVTGWSKWNGLGQGKVVGEKTRQPNLLHRVNRVPCKSPKPRGENKKKGMPTNTWGNYYAQGS